MHVWCQVYIKVDFERNTAYAYLCMCVQCACLYTFTIYGQSVNGGFIQSLSRVFGINFQQLTLSLCMYKLNTLLMQKTTTINNASKIYKIYTGYAYIV